MKIGDMKQSRFVSKTDLPPAPQGMLVTILGVGQENVALPDQPPEMKYTLKFQELQKPFVLNITNAEAIGMILGQDDTDNWDYGKVEIYYDPNIMMAGRKVGGIRFRAPVQQQQAQAQAAPAQQAQPAFDDDIPL